MTIKQLLIFTRTPLHVGAGASVGAIDQPIQRERHTGFPVIPASSLKGSFADHWNDALQAESNGKKVRVTQSGEGSVPAWLFGSDSDKDAFAGSLIFSEARVLAFPVRSAKGSFAWITCPLMLQRAKRDGVISSAIPPEPSQDDHVILQTEGPLALGQQVVLEDYCLSAQGPYPADLANEIADLMPTEEVFQSIKDRLVILTIGMMSHFATTACEVAQHVRISDETGTAEGTGLFNQENVPADTLFYSILGANHGRGKGEVRTANEALVEVRAKIDSSEVFQFGGDASTGLGFCTVTLKS